MSMAFPRVRSAKGPPARWFDHIGDGHCPFLNAPVGTRSIYKHETRLAYEVGSCVSASAQDIT